MMRVELSLLVTLRIVRGPNSMLVLTPIVRILIPGTIMVLACRTVVRQT